MKNLKKVLALVLVIAMVMGFAVSASATEFSDAESIAEQNETAVNVLVELGIINGYPDGTFRPEDTVTRAEVAKMIAVAFNAGDESINDLYANVVCGLTDIGGTWAEGYIKYCYTNNIVDGYPDGTYRPDGEITGLEVCQIMLNILGYELDTTNTPWASAVMAKSSTIGLLTNVSTAIGSACPRQETAQIIYNSLTLPIQEANALGVLISTNKTILSEYLNGSVDTVVITGNEEAALNDDAPLDEGKTEVDNDTILSWSTTRDMIGSSYTVWTVGNTVVYAEDSGMNTVYETNERGNITKSTTGLNLTDAESYVNFDDEADTDYTTEIRIAYVLEIAATDVTDAVIEELEDYGYTVTLTAGEEITLSKSIKAGSEISDNDYAILRYIFANSDDESEYTGEYIGEVYVGTQSETDISDTYSFRKFVAEYLETEGTTVTVSSNVNGNYVKVIDNDGDGYAEYILQTEYEMALVYRENSRYVYLSGEGPVDASTIVTEDELAVGDMVVYALIDGVYYTNLATVVTETVDRDGVNAKAETITCGDNTYGQSDIGFDSGLKAIYEDDVTDAEVQTEYNLYLDNYGFVRLYEESRYGNGFLLMTDGYYITNNRTTSYQAQVYSADEEGLVDIDITSASGRTFVTISDTLANNGAWGSLITAESTYALESDFATNIANYTVSGDTYGLYKVGSRFSVEELDIDSFNSSVATRSLESIDETDDDIQVTTDTIYYFVTKTPGNGIISVESWVGYDNAPSDVELTKSDIAYAVTYPGVATTVYDVAQVVVIEQISVDDALYFFYRTNSTSSYDVTIAYKDSEGEYVSNVNVDKSAMYAGRELNFFVGNTMLTKGDYAANGIYVAEVITTYDVDTKDYVRADYTIPATSSTAASTAKATFYTDSTPVFAVNVKSDGSYTVSDNVGVAKGDQLILVLNARKTAVLYAINVDKSAADLSDLVADILNDVAVTVPKAGLGTLKSSDEKLAVIYVNKDGKLAVDASESITLATLRKLIYSTASTDTVVITAVDAKGNDLAEDTLVKDILAAGLEITVTQTAQDATVASYDVTSEKSVILDIDTVGVTAKVNGTTVADGEYVEKGCTVVVSYDVAGYFYKGSSTSAVNTTAATSANISNYEGEKISYAAIGSVEAAVNLLSSYTKTNPFVYTSTEATRDALIEALGLSGVTVTYDADKAGSTFTADETNKLTGAVEAGKTNAEAAGFTMNVSASGETTQSAKIYAIIKHLYTTSELTAEIKTALESATLASVETAIEEATDAIEGIENAGYAAEDIEVTVTKNADTYQLSYTVTYGETEYSDSWTISLLGS